MIPPKKAEGDQRDEHRREDWILPGCFTQPLEEAVVKPFSALSDLDRTGDGETVDHAGQHSQIHRITGIEHLPFGTDARIDQDMVGAGKLQERI